MSSDMEHYTPNKTEATLIVGKHDLNYKLDGLTEVVSNGYVEVVDIEDSKERVIAISKEKIFPIKTYQTEDTFTYGGSAPKIIKGQKKIRNNKPTNITKPKKKRK